MTGKTAKTIGSAILVALVLLMTITDLFSGFPFAGSTVLGLVFLMCSIALLYLCWDTWLDFGRL